MNTKLFVGNLSFETTENDLQDLFQTYGPVTDVNLVTDRNTGRSRGFAFVTMATPEAAQSAIASLEGQNFNGRTITVSEARPRPEHSGNSGGGGRGGREKGEGRRSFRR